MRHLILGVVAVAVAACAAPSATTRLRPADSATELLAGGALTMRTQTQSPGGNGDDALIQMTLTRADGRAMRFTEANHSPYDVMAQAAGGPLANVMGFFAEETPTLYSADESQAPFICGAEGPAYVGVHQGAGGEVSIVGLKSGFTFEPREGGGYEPVPYSPDHVCARMRFRAQ